MAIFDRLHWCVGAGGWEGRAHAGRGREGEGKGREGREGKGKGIIQIEANRT